MGGQLTRPGHEGDARALWAAELPFAVAEPHGCDAGRLGLVDFDRYALGEPELDVATFLVELETESPRAVGMAELEAATAAGFRAAGGRLDPDRMTLWTAHKRLAKVARTAAALRPDAEARALAHLDRLDLTGLDAVHA